MHFLYFFFLFSLPIFVSASVSYKTEAFISARGRTFEDSPLLKKNFDHLLYLKQEASYLGEDFRATASPFLVSYNSQLGDIGPDPIMTSIVSSDRQMDLQTKFRGDPRTWTVLDFQELFLGWSKGDWSLEVGRRILALGNLKLLPGWNKFNPTGAAFRPTWINGVDQVKAVYQTEKTKTTAYGIADREPLKAAQLLQFDYFMSPFQFSLLVGNWWSANATGFATTADVGGWLLKLEVLNLSYLGTYKNFGDEFQTGLGIETSFAQDWNFNLEFISQSRGETDKAKIISHRLLPHQSFRGRSYVATELRWTPNPFYTFSILGLASLVDSSSLQGATVTRQWGENAEISGGFFVPQGEGEFSPKYKIDLASRGMTGAPAQADVTLRFFF